MRRAPALLLLLVTVLGTVPAAAEHEVYYRYVVLGYVKDARGTPLAGRSVELTRDKTGFSYLADTDDKGFYLIIARLGDESAGEALTLTVGRSRAKLAARLDTANHTEDRGNLDVVTGPFDFIAVVEGPTLDAIGRLVTDEIGAIDGVTRTTTCLAVAIG
ncbi:MAG: Lrp/AsnC ligand binding domain-containing protein [Candidatus Rokubacteria bacterium]|nr:Lrp/AsnC ligand binding domain-containing protein [Candidatus Rokubacteria bacterium]